MTEKTADTSVDYSKTLYLPQTDFPMRAGLPDKEPKILERWTSENLYGALREKAKGRPKFVLHDGPPYANGHLHIGHALNKILKDVITRQKQMEGFDSNYVPGWDCHGLPIEWKIEEKYRAAGKNKDEVPKVEFRAECRAFAEHWVGVQSAEFRRLGVIGDFERPYLTMDYEAEAVIAGEIQKFALNGQLYRGSKPVMWSVVEKTALAEAEVEYQDYTSDTIFVKFPVTAGDLVGASVVIWTTTPWTIPGNRAVSFSNRIAYGVFEVTASPEGNWAKVGEKLVLADKLAEEVMKAAKVEGFTRLRDVTAAELTASRYRSSTATTSPTTVAPASSTPRPGTAARTSRSGWRMPARSICAASTPPSPSPSTTAASSPRTRRASSAAPSSPRTATRATPTRRSSTRWSRPGRCWRVAG